MSENSTARRLKFGHLLLRSWSRRHPLAVIDPRSLSASVRSLPTPCGLFGNSTDDDLLASEGALAAAQISRRARPATSLGSRRSGLSGSVSEPAAPDLGARRRSRRAADLRRRPLPAAAAVAFRVLNDKFVFRGLSRCFSTAMVEDELGSAFPTSLPSIGRAPFAVSASFAALDEENLVGAIGGATSCWASSEDSSYAHNYPDSPAVDVADASRLLGLLARRRWGRRSSTS